MRCACFQTLWQVHEGISREPFGLRPNTQDVLSLTLSKDRSLGRFPVVLIHVTGSNGHVRSSLQNRTRGLCTWGPAPGITQACLDCSDPTGTLLLPLCIGVAQKSPCFSLPTIRSPQLGPLCQVGMCPFGPCARLCTKEREWTLSGLNAPHWRDWQKYPQRSSAEGKPRNCACTGGVLYPLGTWCCIESSLHPSPDALGLTFHPMGIWLHVLFLLFPNNLAWCCMETGFPPCPPGPSAQAWPLPCVFTAP